MTIHHTPGPWHVVHGLYPDGEVEVQGGGANLTGPIAHLANANLIAAAPDLLTGLEAAVEALDAFDVANEMTAELRWMRATIAAAKAEGRNQ
jgi:hypothetical protein